MDWLDSRLSRRQQERRILAENRRREDLGESYRAVASSFLTAEDGGTLGFLFRDGRLTVEFFDDCGASRLVDLRPTGADLDSLASNLTDPRLRDLMGIAPSRLGGTAGSFLPAGTEGGALPASPTASYSVSTAGPHVVLDRAQAAFLGLCREIGGEGGADDRTGGEGVFVLGHGRTTQ